jgi:hypothetical protein
MQIKTWFLVGFGFTLLFVFQPVLAQVPDSSATSAKEMIRAINEAMQIYNVDKGEWPGSVDVLVKDKYLSIPQNISQEWVFSIYQGGLPTSIQAKSLKYFLQCEHGDTTHIPLNMYYSIYEDRWGGDFDPDLRGKSLTEDQHADLAEHAIQAMQAIWDGAQLYYNDKGLWPETVDNLTDQHYVQLNAGLRSQWTFGFVSQTDQVIAVSTNKMPDGAGHTITFDPDTKKWNGYGLSKLAHALDKSLYPHVLYQDGKIKVSK